MDKHVQTVTQVTQSIKETLEGRFRNVWIQGEVSNFKRQSSGHLYFSLKDSGAQISAVMWRGMSTGLPRMPKDGDQLIVHGELNVYAPRGNYQVVVREMQFVGIGELLLKLEELKREIAKRGWFRAEHKKELPKFPKKLGIITSPTGAAIRDVVNVLERRYGRFHLVVNPVRVQGKEAAGEVAQAIRQMNAHKMVDVLIVCRGGGSLEDLWAFNEEVVAKAIFESKIPIICAVGHETDHTIAEYVADLRAPTPSAAAEMVMAETAEHIRFLEQTQVRLKHTLRHLVKHAKEKLRRYAEHPVMTSPYQLLGPWMQQLDETRNEIDGIMEHQVEMNKLRLSALSKQSIALRPSIPHYRGQLDQLVAHLKAIDPRNLLKKGYSVLFAEKTGAVITSARTLKPGDALRARLSDGETTLTVNNVSQL